MSVIKRKQHYRKWAMGFPPGGVHKNSSVQHMLVKKNQWKNHFFDPLYTSVLGHSGIIRHQHLRE
jgi:hypothetical protein